MHASRIQDVYINNLSDSSIFICGAVDRIQSKFVGSKENYLFNIQEIQSNNREDSRLDTPHAAWPNQVNEEDEFEILNDSTKFYRLGLVRPSRLEIVDLFIWRVEPVSSSEK